MDTRNKPTATGSANLVRVVLIALGGLGLISSYAQAQEAKPRPLVLSEVRIAGVRTTATQRWGSCYFTLNNLSDRDRLARVVVYFADRRDVQFGKDIWIPAKSRISSWFPIGPKAFPEKVPANQTEPAVDFHYLVYDRTDGENKVIGSGDEQQKEESRPERIRKLEPTTALMGDLPEAYPWQYERPLPIDETIGAEPYNWCRCFRETIKASPIVYTTNTYTLPTSPLAFEGIDQFVLATNRIREDRAGLRALRQWVEQGGDLVVMLDKVEQETLHELLGSACDFQVLGRTSLLEVTVHRHPPNGGPQESVERRTFQQPVEFVRVLLPTGEYFEHSIDGWPMSFKRRLGRGRVFLLALEAKGWYDNKPNPNANEYPYQSTRSHILLTQAIDTKKEADKEQRDAILPILNEQIGYKIIPRGTVLMVFGIAIGAVLLLALILRRTSRPELVGWLAPLAAIGVSVAFVTMAEVSRRTIPPTTAVLQIVDGVAGVEEASAQGTVAVYRPSSGEAELSVERGGMFEMDFAGVSGQIRLLLADDLDSWTWENVDLPADVRFVDFRHTLQMEEPLAATATFGPNGLTGKITAKPFTGLSDAILQPVSGRLVGLDLNPDGTFEVTSDDELADEQLVRSAVLTDQQQRRKKLYPLFLKRVPDNLSRFYNHNVLFVWADPLEMGFRFAKDARLTGDALLLVPLKLTPPEPGMTVTIPPSLIVVKRQVAGNSLYDPNREGTISTDMLLRFQLPQAALPFEVERAKLRVKIQAPSRKITFSTEPDAKQLLEVESPIDPIELEITEADALGLDDRGGLHVRMKIGDRILDPDEQGEPDQRLDQWKLAYVELEVVGKKKASR